MQKIITHKTDVMQKMIDLVSRGYSRYVSGTVEPQKLEALCLKFDDRYQIHKSHQARYRAKLKGESNAHLVLWLEEKTQVRWWLLVSAGTGLAEQLERLQDAREQHIALTGYELVKTPRVEERAAWTWRMTHETYATWKKRIQNAIRQVSRDDALRQALHSLQRVPGFNGCRKQAFALLRYAEAEWQRVWRGEWPYEKIFITWLGRYKAAETIAVEDVLRKKRRKTDKNREIAENATHPAPNGADLPNSP